MKPYNIWISPLGINEAVKVGWSWPAFGFVWIWCFVKKMYGIGAGLLILYFLLSLLGVLSIELNIVSWIITIITFILMGAFGNQLRENKLQTRGFELKGAIDASSPEGALVLYVTEYQE